MTMNELKNLPIGTIVKYNRSVVDYYRIIKRGWYKCVIAEIYIRGGIIYPYEKIIISFKDFEPDLYKYCHVVSENELNQLKAQIL